MKKTVITSILGVVACTLVSTSYGQGSIFFVNYSFGLNNYSAPVTIYGYGGDGFSGQVLGSDFSAELLYSSTGTAGTFIPLPTSITPFYGTGLGDTADFGGLFQGVGVTVPFYPNVVSGNAFFEVEVYNTDTVNRFGAGELFGFSNIAEVSALATAANLSPVYDLFADNPYIVTPLQPFSIVLIPEPTTIVLSGLGLVSLLAFRFRR